MNKHHSILVSLFLLFGLCFLLRVFLIQQNLFFGPEQGRDLLVVKQMVVNHKLTLIGSKTDIDGVFHGPIFYYLAAIPFVLSGGNPIFISLFFIVLNALTVFFLYDLGKTVKDTRLGVLAAGMFTVSWSANVYARWLSNPPLSIPLSALFFVFLYRFFKGSKRSLLFAAIVFGLLTQAEFLNILFFFLIGIGIFIFYFPVFKKQNPFYLLLCFLIAMVTSLGTYIFFEVKHQFLMTKSILSVLKGTDGYHISYLQAISDTIYGFLSAYSSTILPSAFPISIIILIASVVVLGFMILKKQKNYLVMLLSLIIPIIVLVILHHGILDQFFVALLPVYITLTALFIDFLWQKSRISGIIVLSIVIISNLFMWISTIPQNKNMFFQSTQPDLRYSDQLTTIDTIYREAYGKPFSFQSYTIPYWEQQGWEYLFWSYGQKKYGYYPVAEKAKTLFVIIQNDLSNQPFQQDWLKNTVSKWGKVEKTFQYGVLKVEKLKVE